MPSSPLKVAVPRFGEAVAPCFGFSATVSIFVITGGKVSSHSDFVLQSDRELDRLRLLRDQEVDTLICGGLQDRFEDLIRASGIRVISWVSGNVDELLDSFLHGDLRDGKKQDDSPGTPQPDGKRGQE
jgi:predicted Fe-Mo cluster-binding NifX family protein